jgi:hypothetical protein
MGEAPNTLPNLLLGESGLQLREVIWVCVEEIQV